MGRPQAFDTDEVVRAARQVFWTHGYEDAAMPDLEAATGLGRSSIYHAFGSKRGLFDAAVASYLDEVVGTRLRPLLDPVVDPDAIIDHLTAMQAAVRETDPGSGCLLVNLITAPIAEDEGIRRIIVDYRTLLRAALASGIAAHSPAMKTADVERLALLCSGLIFAALMIGRVDPRGAGDYLELALEAVQQA